MMRLQKFDYLSPLTVEEVCAALDQFGPGGRIMAGGTDLLSAAKLRNIQPTHIIGLKAIDELRGIVYQEEEGLKIGALASLHQVRNHPIVRVSYHALAQAAAAVGSPQIQRMGTLGGNLCLNTRCYFYNQSSGWRKHRPVCLKMGGEVCHVVPKGRRCQAVFSADTPAALIALDAKVKLASCQGIRRISVRDLYTGDGKEPIALHPGEILTEIQLPPMRQQVSVYLKYRIRKSIDFPLVGIAAAVLRGRERSCDRATIALTGVGPAPVEISEAGAFLRDSILSDEVIKKTAGMAVQAAHPVANIGSTPTHRRKMAGLLTRKALDELAKAMASGGGKGAG